MLSFRAGLSVTLLAALTTTVVLAKPIHHSPTGHHTSAHKAKTVTKPKLTGQRQIDTARAREIQQALIQEKYLSGEPSGLWDAESQQAMQKFQSDHGWQTKIMPDSRALIKLGLGPANQNGTSTSSGESKLEVPSQQDTSLLEADHSRTATDHAGR